MSADDLVRALAPALGVLVLSAEAVGVARGLAAKHGYRSTPTATSSALGAANALAGLSSGFVQSGGASQTAGGRQRRRGQPARVARRRRADPAHRRVPRAAFDDLPQATLAAIVIVAVAGFFDVAELRRFAHVRRSAIVFAALALSASSRSACSRACVTAGLRSSTSSRASAARGRRARPRPRRPAPGAASTGRRTGWRPGRARRAQRRAAALPERQRGQGPGAGAGGGASRAAAVVLDLGVTTELDVQTRRRARRARRRAAPATAGSCGWRRCARPRSSAERAGVTDGCVDATLDAAPEAVRLRGYERRGCAAT